MTQSADESGGGEGGTGSGGSGGGMSATGGTGGDDSARPTACTGACCPEDPICYVTDENGVGAECLAKADLSMRSAGQLDLDRDDRRVRLTYRHMWNRSIKPDGAANTVIYGALLPRAELPFPQCNMGSDPLTPDTGGGILIIEADGLAEDKTEHTNVSGYAAFPDDPDAVLEDGLCFTQFIYEDPKRQFPDGEIDHLGMNLPWNVGPGRGQRVLDDFDIADIREEDLADGIGRTYINNATGYTHTYSPLQYVVLHDNPTDPIVLPIHEVETTIQVNDPDDPTCAGAYLADDLDPAAQCRSIDAELPPWGCPADATDCEFAPMVNKGYFKIVEIEQVFSPVLQHTICCQYLPGNGETDGWCSPNDWGRNCRGSPMWNPDDPVNGIPMGDWCSETNSEATAECHDAFRSISYHVLAGFPVKAYDGGAGVCDQGTIVNSDAR